MTTFTHTLADGTVETRSSKTRAYTHVIVAAWSVAEVMKDAEGERVINERIFNEYLALGRKQPSRGFNMEFASKFEDAASYAQAAYDIYMTGIEGRPEDPAYEFVVQWSESEAAAQKAVSKYEKRGMINVRVEEING